MKTEYYVFIMTGKFSSKKVSGPHSALADAKAAEQEVNARLSQPPFAYTVPWMAGY